MGKAARLKREKKISSPLNLKMMEAWNRGFSAGAKQQRESDIERVMKWLGSIEEIPGIGEKRAWEIRRHFLDFFGRDRNGKESDLQQWQ
jgi:ERCC4-type nuclease